MRRRRRGRRRVTGCGRDGVRVQHRRDKEGEQPRVKTEGMRGSAKANGSVLGSVHYDALASHGMSRGVVTAPGGTTSGTPATTSDTQTASSNSTATTSKETTLTVVLTDEAEEKEVRGDISPAASTPSLLIMCCLLSFGRQVLITCFESTMIEFPSLMYYREYIYLPERSDDLRSLVGSKKRGSCAGYGRNRPTI